MKSLRNLLFAACIAFPIGIATSDPLGQQLTFTPGAGTTWDIDWTGVSGRTYFIEWSLDLESWSYAPVVEFETPATPFGTNAQGVDKYFVRLKYIDADWISTLQEARDADFDSDGIPNYFEVEDLFSDPFDRDSNGGDTDLDGLADGWELYFFGNLTTADPSAIDQTDGLTNKEKSELGISPSGDDLTLTTERITYSYDGERLDGVNFYSQREFGYGMDGNGNLDTATSD